jgi:hypothetical protein
MKSPASRLSRILPEHATAAPARQQHDERDSRPQPDRSLNREVHIVLLSFVVAWRGARASVTASQIPYCCVRRVRRRLKKLNKTPKAPSHIKP